MMTAVEIDAPSNGSEANATYQHPLKVKDMTTRDLIENDLPSDDDDEDLDYQEIITYQQESGFETIEIVQDEEEDDEISDDEIQDIVIENAALQSNKYLRNGKNVPTLYRDSINSRTFESEDEEDEDYVESEDLEDQDAEDAMSSDEEIDETESEELSPEEINDIVLDAVTAPAPNLLNASKVLRHGKQLPGGEMPGMEGLVASVNQMMQDVEEDTEDDSE